MIRRCCVLIALAWLVDARAAEAQCTSTVTPMSVSVSSIGSSSALSVITGANCTWTATSTVPWITVTFATGAGLGQVQYTVAANAGTTVRSGTIVVANQTVAFTQAVSSCVYSVTPTSVTVVPTGSTSALSVTSGTSCSWTSTSNVIWITVTGGASGSGIGAVSYRVDPNTGPATRTGTLTVAGQTVTFTQATQSSGTPPETPTNLRIIR